MYLRGLKLMTKNSQVLTLSRGVTKVCKKLFKDERGSISLLVMSLFMIIVITSVILTDVSSIYLAKRSLTQGTEAAAQRAARNLDYEKYYDSKYTAVNLVRNIFGTAETDPGIPIDCRKGESDAYEALSDWSQSGPAVTRVNLKDVRVDVLSCDGYEVSLATSATAALPFVIPFTGVKEVRIQSRVGTIDERKITSNFYGVSIP